MRVFPFLIVIALAIESLAGTGVARFVMRSLEDTRRAAPMFTQFFFGRSELLWIVPAVFTLYAVVIAVRREPSVGSLWIFAGASAIAAALLFAIISIAGILPLLNFKG